MKTFCCLFLVLCAGLFFPTSSFASGRIAFNSARDGNDEIYVMQTDGSQQTRLTYTPDWNERRPRWSPSGDKLLFMAQLGEPGKWDICVMKADGSGRVNLTNTPDVQEVEPGWSPDGSQIVFNRYVDSNLQSLLYIMNADGSNLTVLTPEVGEYGGPSWSPDGRLIAYNKNLKPGAPYGNRQIFAIDVLDPSDIQRLTYNDFDDGAPSWSHDGTRIAFQGAREHFADYSQIFVMNADGSGQTRITDEVWTRLHVPQWSPDDERIIFFKGVSAPEQDIWVIDADGANSLCLVATPGCDAYPDWAGPQLPVASPDGPYLGAVDAPIVFDGTGSFDPGGFPLTYAWDFGDESAGSGAMPTHYYASAGIYDVCLIVNNGTADSDPAWTIAVAYDSSGGFVTGGGWIWSPAGAYAFDLSLSGKANFGFVSKYKKGATVPTGQTEFVFQAGDLNFHSSSYEWLVVTGSDYARFKGAGTINGAGNYKFMLWAGDNDPDTFRIRIWEEDEITGVETDIYDNGFDQEIGGGSIVIHAK